MKKNLLVIITLFAVIFSACAQQKKTTGKNASTNKKVIVAGANHITSVSMSRTPCFGTCPAYTVIVDKTGKVTYKSMHYTEYEGTYEKTFPVEKITALFAQFNKYKVDTCSAEYEMNIADMPGLNFTINYSTKGEKHISNAHFGPDFLKTLSEEVDAFSKVDGTWKKVAEAEKR